MIAFSKTNDMNEATDKYMQNILSNIIYFVELGIEFSYNFFVSPIKIYL